MLIFDWSSVPPTHDPSKILTSSKVWNFLRINLDPPSDWLSWTYQKFYWQKHAWKPILRLIFSRILDHKPNFWTPFWNPIELILLPKEPELNFSIMTKGGYGHLSSTVFEIIVNLYHLPHIWGKWPRAS